MQFFRGLQRRLVSESKREIPSGGLHRAWKQKQWSADTNHVPAATARRQNAWQQAVSRSIAEPRPRPPVELRLAIRVIGELVVRPRAACVSTACLGLAQALQRMEAPLDPSYYWSRPGFFVSRFGGLP